MNLPGHSDGHPSATHQGHNHAALGHAAMVHDHVPAPGGPNDLDALLYPPEGFAVQAGPCARVRARRRRQDGSRSRKGVHFDAWTYNGTVPGPIIRATEDDLLRVKFKNGGSHPHTIHFHGIHPAKMDGVFEIVAPGDSFTYEFPARPARAAALPLPRDAAEEAHPQGPVRRVHHRSEEAAQAGAGARHGHERLRHRRRRREQLLHRQRPRLLLRALPDQGAPVADGSDLPRQPDRVRPRSTRSTCTASSSATTRPARATSSSTRTRSSRPRASAGSSRSTSRTRACSCSTPTSRSSPSSAGWRSST